jgi:hypothetical protein
MERAIAKLRISALVAKKNCKIDRCEWRPCVPEPNPVLVSDQEKCGTSIDYNHKTFLPPDKVLPIEHVFSSCEIEPQTGLHPAEL